MEEITSVVHLLLVKAYYKFKMDASSSEFSFNESRISSEAIDPLPGTPRRAYRGADEDEGLLFPKKFSSLLSLLF